MIISTELLEVMYLSLYVATVGTAIVTPLALFIVWALHNYNVPGKALIYTLLQLPLVLPPVALGYMLLVLLGRRGVLGSFVYDTWGYQIPFSTPAVVIAAVVVAFPLVVRSIQTAFEMAPKGLENAAATLGAGPVRRFITITLPLVAPGVIGGAVLGFARALGEFGATITFAGNITGETQTLPLKIYALMQTPGRESDALVVTGVSVVLAMGAMIFSEYLSRRTRIKRGEV